MRTTRQINLDSLLVALLAVTLFATSAQAETWYLMVPNEKEMSSSHAATVKKKGPVAGPIHFESREEFPSRQQCEPARQKMNDQWRRDSVIKRGSWNELGLTSPNEFILCVPSGDPRLVKPSVQTAVRSQAGERSSGPSMDINIPLKTRWR
jgi:hypothetical protein